MTLSTRLIAIIGVLCIAVTTVVYLLVAPTGLEFYWISLIGLLLAEVMLFGALLFISRKRNDVDSIFFSAGSTTATFLCSAVLFITSLLFIPADAAALGVFLSILLVDLLMEMILLPVFYFIGMHFKKEDAKDISKALIEPTGLEQNNIQISQSRRGGF